MAMAALFYAICLCFLSVAFGKSVVENSPPTWSNFYTVSGVLSLPYAEIVESFQAWFDGKNGRSRIDYYGGKGINRSRYIGTEYRGMPKNDYEIRSLKNLWKDFRIAPLCIRFLLTLLLEAHKNCMHN